MKTQLYNYLLFLSIGLLFGACSKEKIEIPESNNPVFKVEGTMNGESFSLVAGDNDAYMHTMTQNSNGVNVFTGIIDNGDLSFELGVYDGYLDVLSSNSAAQLLNVTPIYSKRQLTPLANLSKDMFDNSANISQIDWYVNDAFMGVNNVEIIEPGNYNVCAMISFMDGSSKTLCNEMILGYQRSANCSINSLISSNGFLTASIDATGGTVTNVEWIVDGVQLTAGMNVQQYIPINSSLLEAIVHFSNGVVRTKRVLVNALNIGNNVEDFTEAETSIGSVINRDFNVRLKVNKGGIQYESESADNSSSSIVLTNYQYYGKNASGNNVYKVSAEIIANVKEVNGTNVVPVSFQAEFGIEIQ